MKKQHVILIFLILKTFGGWSQELTNTNISYNPETKQLDYFTAINSDKSKVHIDFINTRFLLVDFSIPGCKGCVKGIPKVIEFSKKYKDKLDVVMLDCYADHKTWMLYYEHLHNANLPLQLLRDENGVISKAFDINVYPTYMLFDEKGVLIKKWEGRLPSGIDKYIHRQ